MLGGVDRPLGTSLTLLDSTVCIGVVWFNGEVTDVHEDHIVQALFPPSKSLGYISDTTTPLHSIWIQMIALQVTHHPLSLSLSLSLSVSVSVGCSHGYSLPSSCTLS